MTDEPIVIVRLHGGGHDYRPGETIAGEYWIESLDAAQIKAIEASVLWHTEGKGDEDMAVVAFWRRDAEDDQPIDPERHEPFDAVLPNSPLSYDGQIVKIVWCVRVRVFPHRGKDIVGERVFQLATTPRSSYLD